MRTSGYLRIYFDHPVGERSEILFGLVQELTRLCPPFGLYHVGSKPAPGRFRRVTEHTENKVRLLLDGASRMDEDDHFHFNLKTGDNGTFVGDYHITFFGRNRVYVQKTCLPNCLEFYFPLEERFLSEQLEPVVTWFERAVVGLGACYAYINPVVMYDDFHTGRDNVQALAMLQENPVLDLADDYNEWRFFTTRIKTPMWLNVLTPKHMSQLGDLGELSGDLFETKPLGDDLMCIRMRLPLGADASEERVGCYRQLASFLRPIHHDNLLPILFRFPGITRGARKWSQRFLSIETPTPWWKRILPWSRQ